MNKNKETTIDWFGEWFDSEYYHILYKDRDYKEAETFLANLTTKLNLEKGSKILDLACGKGRHSVYLNSLGFDVLGLDLSVNSILEASKCVTDKLSFEVHDMRLPIPSAPFDMVLNAFTSFGYFNNSEDDLKTLNNIYSSLKDDGLFVFDFLNVDYLERNLVSTEIKEVGGVQFNLNRKIENGSILKDIDFEGNGEKHNYQERVDALRYSDFVSYFKEVGFKIRYEFGDYELNPYDKNESKRLILIASKY